MAAHVSGLEEYGLTMESLRRLGSREVRIRVGFKWPGLTPKFLALPLAERRPEMDRRQREALRLARARWPEGAVERVGSPRAPFGFKVTLRADQVSAVTRHRAYSFVDVISISGRTARKLTRKLPPETMLEWYAVRARIAIQIEGQRKGMQSIEDRIVLVKAWSFKDAEARLASEWKAYAKPYLIQSGARARWALEEIVDVYATMETKLYPKGTEVYSKLASRRMRRKYEWHPPGPPRRAR